MSPGGAPTPPGHRLTRPLRRRRASVEALPPSAPGPLGASPPALPACSIKPASPVDAPRRARRAKDKAGFRGGDKFCDHECVIAILRWERWSSPSRRRQVERAVGRRKRSALRRRLLAQCARLRVAYCALRLLCSSLLGIYRCPRRCVYSAVPFRVGRAQSEQRRQRRAT